MTAPSVSFSQEGETSVATSIAETVAKGALNQLVGQGMNDVLSFAGFNLHGDGGISTKLDEILTKLDEISKALSNIQASIDDVMRKMQKGQSQIDYDLNVKPLQNLIDKNDSLLAAYKTLAQVSGAEADQERLTISHLQDAAFLQGLETWNDGLCGLSSQTGLIAAWNSRVRYYYAPLFGQAAAKDIQDHWDLFDSYQALSVNFLVHYYYDTNQPTQARATLSTWLANRNKQLALLRGCTRQEDTGYSFDPTNCQLTPSKVELKALPPKLICHFLNNQWWMWALHLDAGWLQGDQESPPYQYNRNGFTWANQDNGLNLPWGFVPVDIATAFLTACGGRLGSGYDGPAEYWKSGLATQGFMFQPGRAADFLYAVDRQERGAIYEWAIFGEGLPRSRFGQWDGNDDNLNKLGDRYGRRNNIAIGIPTAVPVSAEVMAKYLYD
jgi:hypothetical protein